MPSRTNEIAETIEMLRKLVAFPTVSCDSNLELIHFVRHYLNGLGATMRLTYDEEQRKANLFATLGKSERPGIVLSGHSDVVPVDGQAWSSDPFQLTKRGGRLYGRGTADMKSFIAVVLALAPGFAERNLNVPLHIALSYDEEVGCLGVGRLLADLTHAGIEPSSCIIGEPTMMHPVVAHKGKHGYRCIVRGLACHSAYAPQGVNAIEAAAEAISFLKTMARRHRDQGPFDRGFDVEHTTIHTGVIRGGTALNIVPDECVFDFEFRHLPGVNPDELLAEFKLYVEAQIEPEMKALRSDAGFTVTALSTVPALENPVESEVVELVQELTFDHEIRKVSFGTEAPQFKKANIATVVCGPGSIEQAHQANEFIAIDQIENCVGFVQRLRDRMTVRS